MSAPERVAIVGMAGRFPGAADPDALWRNLAAGVESVRFFDERELLAAGVAPELVRDPSYVPAGMPLAGVELFDAAFFDVNPREAELTDPQQRVFLECAWHALESAALDPERFEGQVAVYAGSGRNNYVLGHVLPNRRVMESMGVVAAALQNEKDFLATRVAYKLDLQGPAVTVQTACSTSLVALHLAAQALLAGECDAALAGGVCIANLRPEGYVYVDGGIFARDGHLRAFDARASGQVGGNGCAVLVLERLEDALARGRRVLAVVRGSALNNDGSRKVSFSAPGVDGQARVIAEALAVAGVHPDEIDCVECHGTGTQLGDPIEVAALTQAFRMRSERRGSCPIGSLKTNIGHLDAAAGAASVIKTVLAMQHEALPPSLGYERANPEIDFAASPFFVNTVLRPWRRGARPRLAGVSSFGMGGTNAHVVLEEPPPAASGGPSRPVQVLPLSARSPAALEAAGAALAAHLEALAADGAPEAALADAAHTLQVGRKAFERRRAVVAGSLAEAAAALRADEPRRGAAGVAPRGGRPVAFLLCGQGTQHAGMTRGLYEREPVFRRALDRTCDVLAPHLPGAPARDLRALLFPAADERAACDALLCRTEWTQPALFAVELALAELLAAWGVRPDALLGHSVGELAAAALAGVLALEDACRLVAARGRLIGALPAGGAMLAVHLAEDALVARLPAELSLAAVNAPELCVASGPEAGVAALEQALAAEGVATRRLHTSHAFHSALMEPVLDAFEAELRGVRLSAPRTRFVSGTTGTWITAEEARDPLYWVRHLRRPVRFADGVRTLCAERPRVLCEVGPGDALAGLARLGAPEGTPVVRTTRHAREEDDDQAVLLRALGALWCAGAAVDWSAFSAGEERRRVALPGYAFQRERYWLDPVAPAADDDEPARALDPADWFWAPSWRRVPDAGARRDGAQRWLVLGDRGGVGRELVRALEQGGDEALLVEPGERFEARARGAWTLDPRNPADYADLLEELGVHGFRPTTVAHLLGLDPLARTSLAALDAAQETLFTSLLFLGQALAARPSGGALRLAVAARGMVEVQEGELDQPEKAMLLGPCKAIEAELEGVRCTALDLDGADAAQDAARLRAELARAEPVPLVAWRGRTRWLPGFEPVRLGPLAPGAGPLRERGVYLITGGLGGIGLALARFLARRARARLILVGRSRVPEESAWRAWVEEHGEDDPTSRRVRALEALRAEGAEVLALSADASDPAAMRAAVERAEARFGALHGVVHAAGLPGDGLLELKSRAAAQRVLAPKVRGTQVLEECLRGRPLDFVLLCSSLASAVTGVGQVDYFAANAYLDAWACFARARGVPAVAVGWDAWREVGMAAGTAVPEALRAERERALRDGLSPAEGCEAFERALASGLAHVLVSTTHLPRRVAASAAAVAARRAPPVSPAATTPAAAAGERAAPAGLHARPALATPYAPPRSPVEEVLCALWSDLLGIAGVGRDDDVFDLGANSLLLMQLSLRVRSRLGVGLSLRALFELRTVARLAERVAALRAPQAAAGETEEVAL